MEDGWLLLEGVQSGNHQIKVSHTGFRDWEESILTDGKPQQVVARLEKPNDSAPQIPMPGDQTVDFNPLHSEAIAIENTSANTSQVGMNQTIHQDVQNTGNELEKPNIQVNTEPGSSFFSPLILGIIGISGLLILTAIVGVGAYMTGFIGGTGNNTTKTSTPVTDTPNDVES